MQWQSGSLHNLHGKYEAESKENIAQKTRAKNKEQQKESECWKNVQKLSSDRRELNTRANVIIYLFI